jgi:hypothetical protein
VFGIVLSVMAIMPVWPLVPIDSGGAGRPTSCCCVASARALCRYSLLVHKMQKGRCESASRASRLFRRILRRGAPIAADGK